MNRILLPVLAVGLLALSQRSFAAIENFSVTLSGDQETPPNSSTASGSGTLSFDTATDTITFLNISYSGLTANSSGAHIHGPAAQGLGAGILYNLATTGNTTLGGTSGTFSGTLTLVASPNGTTYTIADQVSQLEGGLWYLNVHDSAFPAGEIRGQIVPVPEPSTLALLGLGAGALIRRWRRKK